MDFAHLSVLFIDAADLPRKDEAGGNGKRERVAQARLFLYAVEPLLCRLEGIRKFLPPCGMREIARADQPDALAPRPQVEMRDIRVPARGAGIFGMNVQICQIHTLIIPPISSFVNRKRQKSPRIRQKSRRAFCPAACLYRNSYSDLTMLLDILINLIIDFVEYHMFVRKIKVENFRCGRNLT